MRDFASCFSEYAVQVVSETTSCSNYSNTSCSNYSNTSCFPPSLIPSTQNSVTCLYKVILSNQKHVLITVTWSKTNITQGLSIHFGDDPSNSFKLNANSRLFRKKKGSRAMEFGRSKVEIFWDLCEAKYMSGPEPISGYYVLVIVDSEIGLILGNMAEEASFKKFKNGFPMAKFTLISRQEYFSGNTLYSTKAQFCDNGSTHDILISCSGENGGENEGKDNHPILSVSIDKKMVIRVKRLQWNFRGNQSIFLDGLLVDLMWDVHDWFFNPASGSAVFMFRTRSGLESRLWLEDKDKLKHKNQDKVEFSLMIYACKST
ncbi:uncharacterized protein [Nicotiana sylvestris]|uniref:Uncharacterized protein LOC104244407 n=1 Tax=Nicotiana sylvestris TaxID=4096 RepID=A0A1U7YFV3_NICSY|nr:PREDICTED: uncharacterized protein LOC104244407 [Nicotiana sylvestris]